MRRTQTETTAFTIDADEVKKVLADALGIDQARAIYRFKFEGDFTLCGVHIEVEQVKHDEDSAINTARKDSEKCP